MSPRRWFSLSDSQERVLARTLQIVLLGLFLYGIVVWNPGIAINAAGALLVSMLPALICRETKLCMDVGLSLWLTAAVLLHAIGIAGPYQQIWWWDYLTHALSASIVTGIGYAVVSSIDRYSERIHLPEPFLTIFLFLFVVALGVFWEVLEFAVSEASAALGVESVLVIYGVSDIITDIVFTTIGGLLVALWGRDYFRGLARKLLGALSRGEPR